MKAPSFLGSLVVGVRHRSAVEQTHAASIAPGDGLLLEREPNNPHDSGAVKALHGSQHVGYVERGVAGQLSMWMDRGVFFTTTVVLNRRYSMVVDIRPIQPPAKKTKGKTTAKIDGVV